jgi:hypothetical protein
MSKVSCPLVSETHPTPISGAFLSGKNFEPPWEQYVRVAMTQIATHRDYFVAVTQEVVARIAFAGNFVTGKHLWA